MSIWQKAYETYENHAHLAGEVQEGNQQPLTPIWHTVINAQIEITIDKAGNLLDMQRIHNKKTIIPISEASVIRTSTSIRAYALSDQLQYLTSINHDKFLNYTSQLEKWIHSEYSHPKAEAVFSYIKKETLLNDLLHYGVIKIKHKNAMATPQEIIGGHEKDLVRWIVIGCNSNTAPHCWKDTSLFLAHQQYQSSLSIAGKKGFCMIQGAEARLTEKHPGGIVSSPHNAKLISSNDMDGCTFRGRFEDSWQAATISFEASQKVHNALRWLVANQGVILESRRLKPDREASMKFSKKTNPPVYICWNPKGLPVYPSLDLFGNPVSGEEANPSPSDYRDDLRRTLQGHKNMLPDEEDVIIAILRAPSDGRLSITYFQELKASDFRRRIENWYGTCCMPSFQQHSKKPTSPLLYWIVCFAYGAEREKIMQVDDAVIAGELPRLIACMVEGRQIPSNLVQVLCAKARHLISYSAEDKKTERNNRQWLLHTTCAVLRKYLNDLYGKERWTMVLDTECKNKDYCFGRLLAIMEHIERISLDADEQRESNAIRMQSMYCERPLHTLRILNANVIPYLEKIEQKNGYGLRRYFEDMTHEVFTGIEIEGSPEEVEKELNSPLKDVYILGYFLQRNALRAQKKQED